MSRDFSSRPRKTAARPRRLSLELIVATAIDILDSEGSNALTMRRLGRRLGVEAMSLYNYVRSRDHLLDAIAETLVRSMTIDAGGSWEDAVRGYAHAVRDIAHEHPAAFHIIASRTVSNVGDSLPAIEITLEALKQLGVDDQTRVAVFRVLGSYARGYALAETTQRADGDDAQSTPPHAFPHIVQLEDILVTSDAEASFEFGLDILIAGIKSTAALLTAER